MHRQPIKSASGDWNWGSREGIKKMMADYGSENERQNRIRFVKGAILCCSTSVIIEQNCSHWPTSQSAEDILFFFLLSSSFFCWHSSRERVNIVGFSIHKFNLHAVHSAHARYKMKIFSENRLIKWTVPEIISIFSITSKLSTQRRMCRESMTRLYLRFDATSRVVIKFVFIDQPFQSNFIFSPSWNGFLDVIH